MSNIADFTLNLDQFSRKHIPKAMGDFRDAIALEALRGVVMLTPVDTGRLRGNWQTTVSAPAEGSTEELDKSGGMTMAKGADAISSASSRPFESIWLHNGVPYGEFVDQGTPLAPGVHMVEQTVNRLKRRFRTSN